jgi:SNF2 family DNA or RNA helicase
MNLAEFNAKMHGHALRVTAAEALDLPEQIFEKRYCKFEPHAQKIYNNLKTECVAALEHGEITATNVLSQMTRLQQTVDGFLRADRHGEYENVSRAKLDLLTDTLDEMLEAGEKVIVFCRYVPEIYEISRLLSVKGIAHGILDGAVKNKGDPIDRFQKDPQYKVLVCQTQVGGVGITLTAGSVMVFYSNSYSFIDYAQCVGRIHRIGQLRRCLYINLLVEDTVDDHIIAAIEKKKNLSDACVDNWKAIITGGKDTAYLDKIADAKDVETDEAYDTS